MRFNALVVAAMVITSVNAVGRGGFRSLLGGNGHRTGSGPSYGTLEEDLESELTQDPPAHGPEPVSSQGLSRDEWDGLRVPKNAKKDPICDPIVIELSKLWLKVYVLNCEFRALMPVYYKLMKGEDENGKKIKKRKLKSKQTAAYLALSDEHKAKLREFKAEYAGATEKYDETWKQLIAKECSTEYSGLSSMEDMIKWEHFPKL
ncbi:hypothetical protein BASA50_003326 [Batrachochytrium salamandrivorans]|uniref:Cathepsin propeptide inhibitor domain-containing protein n=1 Tax=Batrachochytrium salamandrivorans TaxID=1357716 RepID=A0ABQ8FIV6_9FUNG|nr:hypothetical protein BASA60_000343 [Batrachochytrium salamandrivorans]KAH6576892.1 hypothetical protein BASA62_001141 [Batrachochytrium salamandrivorans]KAH6585386.1 hypothetical protein BASA61_006872 [Batrachochytrium salamandrivorans]KAH6599006.1 hypothetical protein BASA50_003326 [Batrachochytrium salamandrivorans]KAH9251896.1 hypothetical protein BASA81_010216 [Batrachochytrium salamandrivorans]